MRERLCRECGKWHALDAWPRECLPTAPQAQSDTIQVPMFISDTMDPTEHLDGRFYTSKSRYRQVTKAHDCTEIGNDPARLRPRPRPRPDKAANMDALKQAEYMVANGIPVTA